VHKRPLWFQIESVARDGIGGGRFLLVAEWQEESDHWMLTIQNSIDFIDNTAVAATKWKHTGSLQHCGPVRCMKNRLVLVGARRSQRLLLRGRH